MAACGRKPLAPAVIAEAEALLAEGLSMRTVARRVGIGVTSVRRIYHGQRHQRAERDLAPGERRVKQLPGERAPNCPTCGMPLAVAPCRRCRVTHYVTRMKLLAAGLQQRVQPGPFVCVPRGAA